jgi:hypothetical protein
MLLRRILVAPVLVAATIGVLGPWLHGGGDG